MPLLEQDALFLTSNFDQFDAEKQAAAKDWLRRYKDQQDEFGLPPFPSESLRIQSDEESFANMFGGVDKIDYEPLRGSDDPKRDKMQHANIALLSRAYEKQPLEIATRYEFYLNDYSRQKFNKPETDTAGFYSDAAKEMQIQQGQKLVRSRSLDAGFRAAIEGMGSLEKLAAVKSQAATNADSEVDAGAFLEAYGETQKVMSKHAAFIRETVQAVSAEMDGGDVDLEPLKERLLDMPGTERRIVLAALRMEADKAGEKVKGEKGGKFDLFAGKLLQQTGEAAARIASNAMTGNREYESFVNLVPETGSVRFSGNAIKTPEDARKFVRESIAQDMASRASSSGAGPGGVGAFPPMDSRNEITLDEGAQRLIQDAKEREMKRLRVANEIRSIGEAADPIPNVFASTIGTSGAALALMAGTRGLAAPALANAYTNIEFNDLSLKYPQMSTADKTQIAAISGAAQASLDYVGVKALDKLPGIKSLIAQPLTKQLAGRALARGAMSFGQENLVEAGQDIATPALMQALKSDVPGFDWEAEQREFWKGRADVAIGLLPLTLLGIGAASVNEYRGAKNLLSWNDQLGAAGVVETDRVAVIEAAQSGDMGKAQSLLMEAWGRRNPEVAAEYQDAMSQRQTDMSRATAELERLGAIPTLRRDGEGWTVTSNGTSTKFATWEEARDVATAAMGDMERAQTELVASLSDSFMASTPAFLKGESVEFNTDSKGESLVDRVNAGAMTPEQAMEAAVAGGVIKGVTMQEARAIAAEVFGGQNASERAMQFRQDVEKIAVLGRNTVQNGQSRSIVNAAGNERSFLTVVEEVVEGRWKGGLERRAFTKEQGVRWVQLAEAATGAKFLEGSTWEEIAASSETAPRALTEAISRIIVADVLGRMKDGKRIGPGTVSSGLNLNDREQSALAAILDAFRKLFRALLETASKLAKARQEGKLGGEYDALFDALTGGSSQLEHDAGAAKEADAIASEAVDTSGYSPETPGPNGETFSIGRVKNGGRLLTFEKPIETPLGRVVSYEWQSDVIEDVDKDGEAVLKRVSDWDKAVANAETGRAIVHHFTVIQPDGSTKIVSLESALKATKGTETGKALNAAVKAARRLPLREAELAELEKLQADYDAAIQEANSQGWRNAPEPELRTPEFPPLAERGVKAVYVGGQFIKNLEPNELGSFGYKPSETEWKKQWAVGQLQRPPYGTGDRIQLLKRLIKKDKATIESASLFASRAIPADASKVVQMPDGARLVGPTTFSIRAYHGTPHKVDKFTTAKIGTGEGAQAYGWGLYFAERKQVAMDYMEKLGKAPTVEIDNQVVYLGYDALKGVAERSAGKWADLLAIHGGNRRKAINAAKKAKAEVITQNERLAKSGLPTRDFEVVQWDDTINELEKGNGKKAVFKENKYLYTVELLPDQADFLDWDKPLSEQSEKVKAALASVPLQKYDKSVHKDPRAVDIYSWADSNPYGGDTDSKASAEALLKAGIPGIRYLDGGSRGAGDGTRNYVIFDENLVRILEENGKPVSQETFSLRVTPENPIANEIDGVSAKDIFASAKQKFGITRSVYEAGYVLPDGSMLDFSGRSQTSDFKQGADLVFRPVGGRDWMKDQRGIDHREIEWGGMPDYSEQWGAMVDFLRLGAVRVDGNSGMISMHSRAKITAAQASALKAIVVAADGAYLDLEDDAGNRASMSLESGKWGKVQGLLNRWAAGETPEYTGTTFSLRVTPAQDAEYMAAVEAGDMEKAQRMVDAAAKAAGYSNVGLHGTNAHAYSPGETITVFNTRPMSGRGAAFFTSSDKLAGEYGQKVYRTYLKLTNPLAVDVGGQHWSNLAPDTKVNANVTSELAAKKEKTNEGLNKIMFDLFGEEPSAFDPAKIKVESLSDITGEGGHMETDQVAKKARMLGYDGVIFKGVKDSPTAGSFYAHEPSDVFAVFNPNQIKSADPVTRDDAGNVIPLSERFNPVDNRITFSLRPGDFSARMAAKFSLFQAKPELRLAIAQVAKERALRLGAEWIAKGDVIRSAKDIGKEARMREALAYEARMNEYLDGLSENARQTLEFEPSALEDDPLVSAMLDFGKLMSFTTAKKSGKVEAKSGDYDGQPWLPPAWFSKGAGIMPDQMAQAMFDAGLLPDAYTDTLWSELSKRIEATRKDKAAHREAVQAYKAAEKYARDASRAEADQWAENAKKQAGSPKAQRDMLKAALRTLDGILAAAPPEVRARVGGYVKLAGLATDEAMLAEIERRIDKLNVELEKYLKKQAVAEISKLFKKARPDMEAGKKGKGKDADMHALFAAAEAAADMDALAVAGRLADLDARIASGELTSEQEALAMTERGIVELVGDLKNADSGRAFSALDTLRDIYGGAWLKWKIAEIERKERRAGLRQDFIEATGKAGVRTERTKADKVNESLFGKGKAWLLNLSSMREVLAYAFGLDNERVTSLVDAERTASNTYEDANQRLGDEIEGLFTEMAGTRTKGERLRWNLSQRTIKTGKGELSQLEAIQALLMWRQEDGRRHMEGTRDESGKVTSSWSYDQAWIDEIEAALTPEARQVMSFIMGKYAAEWATLNPLYRARYGVNMPHHDAYAPITVTPVQTKAGEVVDPVTGSAVSGGSILTPGSLRTRSRNAIAEPDFRDALQTMILHSRQMEYWKAYYDLAVEMNAVLGNREVMNSVHAKGGKEAANALRQWIDVIGQGGFRDASLRLALFQAGSKLQGRAAGVALLGRMSAILSQSTQLAAASVKMPVTSYLVRLAKLMTGGLGWRDAMRSDFIQRRFKTAPPIVRQAMDSLASAKPNEIQQLSRFFGNVLSGADAFFTSGTYAILLDYHREQGRAAGLTGAELDAYAHTEAERATEQVAQPLRTANRSLAELSNTGPLGKIGWAFASEARQKVALAAHAALNAKNDPVTAAKSAFLTFAIGGLFSQVLKNLLREAKGDDDREMWSLGRLGYAMTIAPLASAIPFGSAIAGDSNMLSNIQRAIQTLGNEEVDFRDVDAMLSAAGLFNDTAASLAQLSHLGLDLGKILANAAD